MCMPVIYAFVMLTFFIPTDARSAAQRARQERERQARQANGSGSIPNARSLAQQARRQRERLEREQLMQEQRNQDRELRQNNEQRPSGMPLTFHFYTGYR